MKQFDPFILPGSMRQQPRSRTAGRIAALAAALWLCMIPLRAMVMGYILPDAPEAPALAQVPELLLIGVYDFAYTLAITLLAFAGIGVVGRWKFTRGVIFVIFLLVAIVSLLWSLANIKLVAMLGRPFSFQWLYYSDFLNSFDAKQAMHDSLADSVHGLPRAAWYAIGTVATMVALACVIGMIGRACVPRFASAREIVFALVPVGCAYIAFGHWYLTKEKWPGAKLQNPVVSFAASVVRAHNAPRLLTMATSFGPDDFQTFAKRSSAGITRQAPSGIRNIIVFVMESLPAEYVGAYGGKFPVTPQLDKYRDRAAIFRNIYAHAPSTNMSMLSILCSAYPMLSYTSITEEQPDIGLPSISNELHQRGWRTGFFYGADLSYQNARQFLESRGFDFIQDGSQRDCSRKFESKKWGYLSGSDDDCTVESLIKWIDENPGKPFFATAWTMMTHFPYFVRGESLAYGIKDQYLAKYLNALRCSDESFGGMMHALEQRKLLESTLVIVVGDHGEAFNQHGTYGHASGVYEENLHVPLMLINPKPFHGEQFETIGGLNDIAPTVMELLGIQQPGQWQGRSLWAEDRPGRVYFFSPWSDLLFGYRERNRTLIFNATRNACEVYDLGKDPSQREDLAYVSTDFVREGQQRLAAWVQFQSQFYKALTGNRPDN